MEMRFESELTNRGWLLDPRLHSWLHAFDDRAARYISPPVGVTEDNVAYHFYFEMPGLKHESINASVEDGRLVVSAERKRPEYAAETQLRVEERVYGTIRRQFELPKDASPEKIEASYRDGVLEVTVAKKSESKSARIQIN
jgi:HSP20 family protein